MEKPSVSLGFSHERVILGNRYFIVFFCSPHIRLELEQHANENQGLTTRLQLFLGSLLFYYFYVNFLINSCDSSPRISRWFLHSACPHLMSLISQSLATRRPLLGSFCFASLLLLAPTPAQCFKTTAIKKFFSETLKYYPLPKNVLSDFFLLFASESGALIVH